MLINKQLYFCIATTTLRTNPNENSNFNADEVILEVRMNVLSRLAMAHFEAIAIIVIVGSALLSVYNIVNGSHFW